MGFNSQILESFLFLNNGPFIKNGNLEEIEYSQTAGPRFLYKNKRLTLDGYALLAIW